jgi:hypothetical protein
MVQIGEGGLLPRLEAQQRAIRTLSLHSRPIAYVGSPGSMQHPWSAGRCPASRRKAVNDVRTHERLSRAYEIAKDRSIQGVMGSRPS